MTNTKIAAVNAELSRFASIASNPDWLATLATLSRPENARALAALDAVPRTPSRVRTLVCAAIIAATGCARLAAGPRPLPPGSRMEHTPPAHVVYPSAASDCVRGKGGR